VFRITFDDSSFQNTSHHFLAFKKCFYNKFKKNKIIVPKDWSVFRAWIFTLFASEHDFDYVLCHV
jgi:hypothetical protein